VVITFSLSLPRDEVSVPLVRHICHDALRRVGVEESCASDIELALTEACTNVLKHAQGTKEEYDVIFELNDRCCEIRVVDSGGGFDHARAGDAEANMAAEGGRGIHLMRALVDKVDFVSKPQDGTIVRLEKTLDLIPSSLLERMAENGART
jgi:serine/threonine-protein kinase RsbW